MLCVRSCAVGSNPQTVNNNPDRVINNMVCVNPVMVVMQIL